MLDAKIGEIIKQIRKSKKKTLQELSDETGFSISYLSMLERGLNSPTITNLQIICQCLDITLSDLITNLERSRIYISKDSRDLIFEEEDGGVVYEAISEGARHITGICMKVYDNELHESAKHIADEFGYVVSGSIDMTVNGITYHLSEGDSLYICAQSQHSFCKTSREPCISVWAYHNISLEDDINHIM